MGRQPSSANWQEWGEKKKLTGYSCQASEPYVGNENGIQSVRPD